MLNAAQLKFSVRQAGELPAWISDPTVGRSLRIWPLASAKTVTLRLGQQSVFVKVREASSLLVGEIVGVEPGHTLPAEVRIGELIVFSRSHVFAASD